MVYYLVEWKDMRKVELKAVLKALMMVLSRESLRVARKVVKTAL